MWAALADSKSAGPEEGCTSLFVQLSPKQSWTRTCAPAGQDAACAHWWPVQSAPRGDSGRSAGRVPARCWPRGRVCWPAPAPGGGSLAVPELSPSAFVLTKCLAFHEPAFPRRSEVAVWILNTLYNLKWLFPQETCEWDVFPLRQGLLRCRKAGSSGNGAKQAVDGCGGPADR